MSVIRRRKSLPQVRREMKYLCKYIGRISLKVCRWDTEKLHSTGAVWIVDNRDYLIDLCRSIMVDCKSSRKIGQNAWAIAFELCQNIFDDPESQMDSQKCVDAGLAIHEVDSMPFLLRYFALCRVGQACECLAEMGLENYGQAGALFPSGVKALRVLDQMDFETWRLNACCCERILVQDNLRSKESLATRHAGRRMISKLALEAKCSQQRIARETMHISGGISAALIGQEQNSLRKQLDLPVRDLKKGLKLKIAFWVTLSVVLTGLAMISIPHGYLSAPMMYVIALSVVVQWGLSLRPPKTPFRLPQLCDKKGIPEGGETLIVIPALIGNVQKLDECFAQLDVLMHGQKDERLQYVLLADVPESKQPSHTLEKTLIQAGKEHVEQRNKKYGEKFAFVLRQRTLMQPDGIWMGRERKRGALEDLIAYMNGEKIPIKMFGNIRSARYLLTLDDGSILEPGGACSLICTMMHPANKAVLHGGRVTKGYGILQPVVQLMPKANMTRYASWTMPFQGRNPYAQYTSDYYMATYGQGAFVGKGLIDIDCYQKVLKAKLPEGKILSHDLIEGAMMSCGQCSLASVFETAPANRLSDTKRLHRWIRGDIQNLIFLRRAWHLSMLTKWRLIENVRRIFLPLMQLLLVAFGLYWSSWQWIVLAFAPQLYCLLRLGFGCLGARTYACLMSCLKQIRSAILEWVFLPQLAFTHLDGMIRAVYRMVVSGKRLLEWVPAADHEATNKNDVVPMLKAFSWNCLFALFVMVWGIYIQNYLVVVLGVVWYFAPVLAEYLASAKQMHVLSQNQRQWLLSEAEKIWKFFADTMNEQTHFLPPDNIQKPHERVAMRTSPSNIGLGLASCAVACEMGFISQDEAVHRIHQGFMSLVSLKHFQGIPYNWYDLKTMQVLPEPFVSSVDAGNLAACLMVICEFLKERKIAHSLVNQIQEYLKNMQLSELFDPVRKLFYIGIRPGQKQEITHYDLYASESRILSMTALALGMVPAEHFVHLARPLVGKRASRTLYSWSGTLFEYLMPLLFLPSIEGTLPQMVEKGALIAQMAYIRRKKMPLGVSESACLTVDGDWNFQYRAFGLPLCAISGQITGDVACPYSAYLALQVHPRKAIKGLQAYQNLDAYGPYGLYEAVDYSTERLPAGQKHSPVECYMSHHMGMSLLALSNCLYSGMVQKWYSKRADVTAFLSLYHEVAPMGRVKKRLPPLPKVQMRPLPVGAQVSPWTLPPSLQMLSSPYHTTLISASGDGTAYFCGNRIAGWNADAVVPKPAIRLLWQNRGKFGSFLPMGRGERLYAPRVVKGGGYMRFSGKADQMNSRVEIMVDPIHNVEVRLLRVTNPTQSTQRITLWCELDLSLSRAKDYDAHPAFRNLFLETQWIEHEQILLAQRHPRENDEQPLFAGLQVLCDEPGAKMVYESDAFVVPGRSLSGIPSDKGHVGRITDGVLAVGVVIEIPAGRKAEVRFLLCGGHRQQEVIDRLTQCARPQNRKKIRSEACRYARLERAVVNIDDQDQEQALYLASLMIYGWQTKTPTVYSQVDHLWQMGISGDHPILLWYGKQAEKAVKALRIHAYLLHKQLQHDIAIVLPTENSYRRPIHDALMAEIERLRLSHSVHLVEECMLNEECKQTLMNRSIQVDMPIKTRRRKAPISVPQQRTMTGLPKTTFCDDGRGVCMDMQDGKDTPRPWCNVIANPQMGMVISQKGSAYSWYQNSREGRLTPWWNDAVHDPISQQIWVGDMRNNTVWPLFGSGNICTHAFGSSTFESKSQGLNQTVKTFVDSTLPIQYWQVKLTNTGTFTRQLSICLQLDVCPGALRREDRQGIEILQQNDRLLGRNHYRKNAPKILLCAPKQKVETITSRENLLDASGHVIAFGRSQWQTGAGGDPCMAMRTLIKIPPGETRHVLFVMAAGEDEEKMHALLDELTIEDGDAKEEQVKNMWDLHLDQCMINTPDIDLNRLFDWARYQALCCRFWARSGFYQSGGAYGFRDQLQDVLCLLETHSDIVRDWILTCAQHQFLEGDVQHWWHSPRTGVRTHVKDDMLFLPFVVARYVTVTGDNTILDEMTPYLDAPILEEDMHDRYDTPKVAQLKEGLFDHCVRAIHMAWKTGVHGLPLMGGGDWNDAMNCVGENGGESVWLGMFLLTVLNEFVPLVEKRGSHDLLDEWKPKMQQLRQAIESAWDGAWYKRAYFGDGTALGNAGNKECEIDAITQAWSAFALGNTQKTQLAISQAMDKLWDPEGKLLRLLWPPFTKEGRNAGYINAYPPGIRENGGQYTHAACWMVLALCKIGKRQEAWDLLQNMNPHRLLKDPQRIKQYKGEPYVLAADIYALPPMQGQAGWTWYSGSASWMAQTILNGILGFTKTGNTVTICPCIPPDWKGYSISYRFGYSRYEINVRIGQAKVVLDGQVQAQNSFNLSDDGKFHTVDFWVDVDKCPKEE